VFSTTVLCRERKKLKYRKKNSWILTVSVLYCYIMIRPECTAAFSIWFIILCMCDASSKLIILFICIPAYYIILQLRVWNIYKLFLDIVQYSYYIPTAKTQVLNKPWKSWHLTVIHQTVTNLKRACFDRYFINVMYLTCIPTTKCSTYNAFIIKMTNYPRNTLDPERSLR